MIQPVADFACLLTCGCAAFSWSEIENKIKKAKIMKGKLAILAMAGAIAVTLTACNGYYAYDYRNGYYSPYGNRYDYKGGPAYGYSSGYYPHMYNWYSQPLYGRGYWGGYNDPDQGSPRL